MMTTFKAVTPNAFNNKRLMIVLNLRDKLAKETPYSRGFFGWPF